MNLEDLNNIGSSPDEYDLSSEHIHHVVFDRCSIIIFMADGTATTASAECDYGCPFLKYKNYSKGKDF